MKKGLTRPSAPPLPGLKLNIQVAKVCRTITSLLSLTNIISLMAENKQTNKQKPQTCHVKAILPVKIVSFHLIV